MKWKLRVKWNQMRKRLQESVARCDGKYFIFRGSHKNYLRNGAWVLEDSIALFHGRANPLRHFSVGELNTMNVETVLIHKSFKRALYKGSWEGRDVFVVLHAGYINHSCRCRKSYMREIVVAAQMATHTNVHKLLGCCLETVTPVLVYEWVAPQTLQDCILLKEDIQHQRVVLEWKDRLRIAWEISHIIAYLHTAFLRPILYRNLNPIYIFLSPERDIKFTNFSLCASIPKNQEFAILPISGRFGFIAPEYIASLKARESADVYSFGILLLMLLTGKNPSANGPQRDTEVYPSVTIRMSAKAREMCIYKKIDPTITRNGVTDIEELQLRYSIQTALLCVAPKENCRPTMVEVATELMNIIKSPQKFVTSSISKMFQSEHFNNHTSYFNDEESYDCDDDNSDNNDEESYDCDDDNSDNNDEEYYDCEQNNDRCNDDAQG